MLIPIDKYLILETNTIRDALNRLNILEKHTLFAIDENGFLKGTLTDGDIRRGFLNGLDMESNVLDFMNTNYRSYSEKSFDRNLIEELKKDNISVVPVLDFEGKIKRLIDFTKTKSILPFTAVIMAGGRGERLKPLTDNCPKPMLKIGSKPIIEYTIDRLIDFGISNFYISVRYLADQIISYFGNGSSKGINITYLNEKEPLGTFGSLSLIDINQIEHDHLLVMNSDLLTNLNFEDFFLDYINNEALFSVATIPYTVKIPYAILETNSGIVKKLVEKPSYTYHANAGIYLFHRTLINSLKKSSFINATDFCEGLINSSKSVMQYQILDYWLDIGKHEDYTKAQNDVKYLKF